MTDTGPVDWIPDSCTLPTAQQPLRSREFAELLGRGVVRTERLGSTELLLQLRPEPDVVARVAELAAREVGCCAFFTFTLDIAADRTALRVSVPAAQVGVLDALAASAPA